MQKQSKQTQAFVDAIEGPAATLLVGTQAFSLPITLLPRAAREGAWVRLEVTVVPGPPDETSARRARLGKDDPGGDVKL